MKILYVLAEPTLGGGVKVVFQHADLLSKLGHSVHILGNGDRPDWVAAHVGYSNLMKGCLGIPVQDLVIATYWTTVKFAEQLMLGPVVHFCQGYEGGLVHMEGHLQEIYSAYSRPSPVLVVSPHLGDLMKSQFKRPSFLTPPSIDLNFKPRLRFFPQERPIVLVHGIYEAESKNVKTALRAMQILREDGFDFTLWRISTFPLSREETCIIRPDRYMQNCPPETVAQLTRKVDIALCPCNESEGFGLPLLEAMQSQVPVVAADTPASRFVTQGMLELVQTYDAQAYAQQVKLALSQPVTWRKLRKVGARAARRFSPENIARELDVAIQNAHQLVR
ncbi:glycosyltransferase [Halioglobus maricola]|uniref:Glycosyltransferase n=1 Tax=Halioglobus maricola TaxID=2601894 RepID=A0A5P9NF71_9GAMM|nr:glycosyltransferase family 4 protein [Halioglobus maricola]QFU74412.1 glycosyltransferase [Halioglobus maricola]